MASLILLAGGDPTHLPTLARGLLKNGYNTVVAEDGRSALLKLIQMSVPQATTSTAETVDSVVAMLLDASLPGMKCEDVIRSIRNSSTNEVRADIPIFVFSADTSPENSARFIKAGADAMLSKPLIARDVLAALQNDTDPGQPAESSSTDAHEMRLRSFEELAQDFEISQEDARLLAQQTLEEAPNGVRALVRALEEKDGQAAAHAAHFLAGSLLAILCVGPAQAARELEQTILYGTGDAPETPLKDGLPQKPAAIDAGLERRARSLAAAIENVLERLAERYA